MGLRNPLALVLVVGCQGSPMGHTGFASMPEVTTASAGSSTGSSSHSTSTGTSTSEVSGSEGSGDSTSGPVRDLGGMPDFGDGSPVGCKGKIDFLFVISRDANMQYRQAQLAAAFPQFIDTIQSKFDDFDYHIMVVTGDDEWGNLACNEVCPDLTCKVGEPCCSWYHQDAKGTPCCPAPDYPCDELDLVTQCDRTWGAGEVFPAGVSGEANEPCPIDGDRRYLVKGQSNLEDTFTCIATVGASGNTMLGQALTAAMQSNINDPGGCNNGFLRKDALLMVTLIATNPDGPAGAPATSKGTPAEWAQAVIDAKHGDDKSVVALDIGGTGECKESDRICQLTEIFPYHHHESVLVANYGPAFGEAAGLVEAACAGFAPPG
jgi:hypothetical protein